LSAKARSGRVGLLELESGSRGRWVADPTGGARLSATKERGSRNGPGERKRAGWLGCVVKKKRGRGEGEGVGLALGWAIGKGGKGFAFLEMFPNQ